MTLTPAMGTSEASISPSVTPRVAELRELFRKEYGFFKEVVDHGAAMFGAAWTEEFEQTLKGLFPTQSALAQAAKGYARFVMALIRLQAQFEKDRRYPDKSYADAAREVYLDEQYMLTQYLPGLLLSHYLWPHHWRHARFFDYAFVTQMQVHPRPRFVEVGIGTGLYSRRLLQQVPSASGLGFDLSPGSKAFAEAHVRAFGLDDRYEAVLQDVLLNPISPCEWLVCIEVLEHLEDPTSFLGMLRESLVPGGRAFITAALNSAHIDHIYLYETPEGVHDQLRAAGFRLEQGFVAPASAPSTPGAPVAAVAAFIVS